MATGVMDLAEQERDDLAGLVNGLSAAQWQEPSLCAGWTVRDVVAHVLSYEERGPLGLASCFARGLMSFDRTNAVAMADYAGYEPDQLTSLLDRYRRPHGLTAMMGGRIALTDGMIHQQDIRRPLGLPRAIPSDRLVAALDVARSAPTLGSRSRVAGLRLVATDLDWSSGSGEEVRGPGEALLMGVAGRRASLDELDGPGVATLAGRR